jgi:hypothetical protein
MRAHDLRGSSAHAKNSHERRQLPAILIEQRPGIRAGTADSFGSEGQVREAHF